MTKINLEAKTLKALDTFRATAAKGRRAALFFSAGIHTQFASLDRAERGALKVAIVANSVKFDREAAKAAKVSYEDWCKAKCHSRHSVMANVETDMKQNTRFPICVWYPNFAPWFRNACLDTSAALLTSRKPQDSL